MGRDGHGCVQPTSIPTYDMAKGLRNASADTSRYGRESEPGRESGVGHGEADELQALLCNSQTCGALHSSLHLHVGETDIAELASSIRSIDQECPKT